MSVVIQFPAPTTAATFAALATARHREALAFKAAGAEAVYHRLMGDVRRLDGEAHAARVREGRLEEQRRQRDEEHRRTAQTLAAVLELAERTREGA